MTEEERLLAGKWFNPYQSDLAARKLRAHNLCSDYNLTHEDETDRRNRILDQLLGARGEGVFLQGPIFFNYGVHTTIGSHFFCNYNVMISDDALVTIGDDVMFGPNCTLVTPSHPLLASERAGMTDREGRTFPPCRALPITIGSRVWLGASVTVCGGVTIGDGCVIGAGSVVTRDIPANSVAAGVPCRVLRAITGEDSIQAELLA